MPPTPGYHGYSQTLGDSNAIIFDTVGASTSQKHRGIRGIEVWCETYDALLTLDPTAQYDGSASEAPIIAGAAPVQFFAESTFSNIMAKNRVGGNNSVLHWRTIYT